MVEANGIEQSNVDSNLIFLGLVLVIGLTRSHTPCHKLPQGVKGPVLNTLKENLHTPIFNV